MAMMTERLLQAISLLELSVTELRERLNRSAAAGDLRPLRPGEDDALELAQNAELVELGQAPWSMAREPAGPTLVDGLEPDVWCTTAPARAVANAHGLRFAVCASDPKEAEELKWLLLAVRSRLRLFEQIARFTAAAPLGSVSVASLGRGLGLHPATIERVLKRGIVLRDGTLTRLDQLISRTDV